MASPGTSTADPAQSGVASVAAALLHTARAALGIGAAELAEAAGCDTQLVLDIEHGRLDPSLDTVDRMLNSVGLELRAGAAERPNPAYASPRPDPAEIVRVRGRAETDRILRARHGLRPSGPPTGTQSDWDGNDPAPPRRIGAGPGRRCSGGWGHLLTLTAQRGPDGAFHIPDPDGTAATTASGIERALAVGGQSLHVRIEPYDDHDDLLHLAAEANPARHARIMAANEDTTDSARRQATADRAVASTRA